MGEHLTAKELGVHPKELEALIWVRDALDPNIPDHDLPEWIYFDMDEWATVETDQPLYKCGSACCIGGSMEMYLAGLHNKQVGDTISEAEYTGLGGVINVVTGGMAQIFSDNLRPLFHPYNSQKNTREGGVAAIDLFLGGNTADPWLCGNQE